MPQMEPHNNPWKILSAATQYENNWIKIVENKVLNPVGNNGIYGVVHFKTHAIAIIPLDENNHTWIVGQHRFPLDTYEWEIIEGGCPIGTSPLDTAHRELHEEAGLKADSMQCILKMQLSNSTTDEISYTYIARGLTYIGANPEEDEQLTIKKLPFDEIFQMVLNGEIKDALSVASILKTKILLDKGEI